MTTGALPTPSLLRSLLCASLNAEKARSTPELGVTEHSKHLINKMIIIINLHK